MTKSWKIEIDYNNGFALKPDYLQVLAADLGECPMLVEGAQALVYSMQNYRRSPDGYLPGQMFADLLSLMPILRESLLLVGNPDTKRAKLVRASDILYGITTLELVKKELAELEDRQKDPN